MIGYSKIITVITTIIIIIIIHLSADTDENAMLSPALFAYVRTTMVSDYNSWNISSTQGRRSRRGGQYPHFLRLGQDINGPSHFLL
jgi:hypothetical protein